MKKRLNINLCKIYPVFFLYMQGVRSQEGTWSGTATKCCILEGSHGLPTQRYIWDTLELNYGEIMPNNQSKSFIYGSNYLNLVIGYSACRSNDLNISE